MTIKDYLDKDELYEQLKDYNEYKVYHVWTKGDEDACTGYPVYLIEKGDSMRLASLEETIAIMRANNDDEE